LSPFSAHLAEKYKTSVVAVIALDYKEEEIDMKKSFDL